MISFEDFSIRIGRPRESGQHEVTVMSASGSKTELVTFPFGRTELESILAELDALMYRSTSPRSDTPTPDPETPPDAGATRDTGRRTAGGDPGLPDRIGGQLFDALFVGSVRTLFDASLSPTGQRKLRIRLEMDLDSVGHVASLPWELLYAHDLRQRLAMANRTTVVRYLDGPRPGGLVPFTPPLRILFVMANPRGDLKIELEDDEIRTILAAEKGSIEPAFLPNATSVALEQALHDNDYHIIHFMGHGEFVDGAGELVLEDRTVSGTLLATWLANEPATRLVVLNACRTASFARDAGRDPFAGVATAAVMAGIPAVVAMQFPIADRAAIDFAARFYSNLALGRSVEEAVDAGRRKLSGTPAWATPVLFSQCGDDLFTDTGDAAAPRPRPGGVATSQALSQRDLLPFMPDCIEVVRELSDAIRAQSERPGRPVVAIVHGDDDQCLDVFLRRLAEIELPAVLGDDARNGIVTFAPEWPKEYAPGDFEKNLYWALARQARPSATTIDALYDHFATFPGPVMISSQLLSREWTRSGEDSLRAFLTWWNGWPARARHLRLLVFLFIKYQIPESGWLARRQAQNRASEIERTVAGIEPADFDSLILAKTRRLQLICEQDVRDWSAAHQRPLSDDQIAAIFNAYRKETKRDCMPMKEIARRLDAELSRKRN